MQKCLIKQHFNQQVDLKLPCNLCIKTFSTKLKLREHLRFTHQSQQECDICEKNFSNKMNLNNHKSKFHINNLLSYYCNQRQQQFDNKYNFLRHSKVHENKEKKNVIKYYPCPNCKESFIHLRDLFNREKKYEKTTYACDQFLNKRISRSNCIVKGRV